MSDVARRTASLASPPGLSSQADYPLTSFFNRTALHSAAHVTAAAGRMRTSGNTVRPVRTINLKTPKYKKIKIKKIK